MEAIEVTRLFHWFHLTCHLRAKYDAAVEECVETGMANLFNCKLVNELADPKLTAVPLKSEREASASRLLSR